MAGHHTEFSREKMEERFEFTPESKKKFFITMALGFVLFVVGVGLLYQAHLHGNGHGHEAGKDGHQTHWYARIIANIWLNGVFFTGISVVGMFFVAIQYLSWAGWSSILKRIPEAFPAFLPIGAIVLLATFFIFKQDLFHWAHEGITDPKNHNYDEILAGKSAFLNVPFFVIRTLIYFIAWYGLWFLLRKHSLQEDAMGGDSHWYKMKTVSRVFILLFAVTSSMAAWDWVMSIDSHWFSTMFGWYMFASWHVTGLATITLALMLLQEKGYLKHINENHYHDLGKFMFGFSIFWTYVWFSQFLLIYYANFPEETVYFLARWEGYHGLYRTPLILSVLMNFLLPLLWLMTRDAKRNKLFMKIACMIIIVGHYFDFYQMIMPGVAKETGGFGLVEWGSVLFFASLFGFMYYTQLEKASLVAKNHPMLEEAIHHDI